VNGFEFEHPYALLLILLYIVCSIFCKAKSNRLLFVNVKVFKSGVRVKSILQELLKAVAIIALSIALASPITKDIIKNQNTKGYDISLVLDVSGSMNRAGKFTTVKRVVRDFIKRRKNDRLALTVFADFAYVAVPLTYDKKSILRLLDHIDVGIAGVQNTALYEALFLSTKIFENSKAKNKIAILLTDGEETVFNIPLEVAINTAKKHGIKVYTIGVGTPGDFNPMVLKKIAKETGGKFYMATNPKRLQEIYREIDRLEKSKIKADKFIKKQYYFEYFALIAFVAIAILIFLRRRG